VIKVLSLIGRVLMLNYLRDLVGVPLGCYSGYGATVY
jgi:hypothetical protein